MFNRAPNIYAIKAAEAEGFSPLNAFDVALLKSGVGNTNLVKMSSILPPSCKKKEHIELPPGDLVPVAYAALTSSKKGQRIAAAVAIAIPKDPTKNGLIMEFEDYNITKEEAEKQVRKMAEWGMKYRGFEIDRIESISVDHVVEEHGAVFACVVLWWE
ncbi:pyruvoyl-dependent arginine decarboxylase [Hippea sp. KM1]|uniref:pyruvoyl-dependent arginine decarboxylase n=1 Tax=Hippea sp. KM1 TaxID=944481 RepID=UPI00046D80B3|nr:arginine decarboxylase, pyruvoyl-dependent [Hippea sp. KM1]